jgi:CRISPR/Cas system-associated protein endoribonuclease Cas2
MLQKKKKKKERKFQSNILVNIWYIHLQYSISTIILKHMIQSEKNQM